MSRGEYIYIINIEGASHVDEQTWELAQSLSAMVKNKSTDVPAHWKKVWRKEVNENAVLEVYVIPE